MERASCSCALRVRRGLFVSSFSVVLRGATSEGENEGDGGSSTTGSAIKSLHFFFRAVMAQRVRVEVGG